MNGLLIRGVALLVSCVTFCRFGRLAASRGPLQDRVGTTKKTLLQCNASLRQECRHDIVVSVSQ